MENQLDKFQTSPIEPTESPSIQYPIGDVELDFWGSNVATQEIRIYGGDNARAITLIQLDGPEDAFLITKRSTALNSLGNDEFTTHIFDIQAGPNGAIPGTYNFGVRVADGSIADIATFQVHQQQIRTLWNGNVIQAEDSNFGNGYGIAELSDTFNGNHNSYRKDGLDVSQTSDGLVTYVSHIQAGERTSYTAWTPAGEKTLRVMAATDSTSEKRFDVYVDSVYQGTGVISRLDETSGSTWEDFQPVDVTVNLNGYYETIEFVFRDGGINFDSFSLLEASSAEMGMESSPAEDSRNVGALLAGENTINVSDIGPVSDIPQSKALLGINAGGQSITESGVAYVGDVNGAAKDWLTGTTFTFQDSVSKGPNGLQNLAATTADTERWSKPDTRGSGVFGYSIPEEFLGGNLGQSFYVELDFAEIYFTGRGKRKFDVIIEGQLVLEDFDINAETNQEYNSVVTKRFNGFRTSDFGDPTKLEILFLSGSAIGGINHAKVSAIRVYESLDPHATDFMGPNSLPTLAP